MGNAVSVAAKVTVCLPAARIPFESRDFIIAHISCVSITGPDIYLATTETNMPIPKTEYSKIPKGLGRK